MDYYSWILHLKLICITVFYKTFILINTRNMIYYIVIIYYEPPYKICIYFLRLFLISTCTFGNGNNISIIIHFVYDSIFMPIIIGLQINIITYHIMLLMELRDEPYRLFQNIDNSNMNDDIMYLLMWITLSMVQIYLTAIVHVIPEYLSF